MVQKIIGILGGMGPEATNKLCHDIVNQTPANKDQDHIPIIVFNNPKIPDRTESILYQGKNPLPELVATAIKLESAGAGFIIIPCNSAHYFINDIQTYVNIPILNMIEETVNFVKENYPEVKKVGLLATSGTVYSGLYSKEFKKVDIEVVVPTEKTQKEAVMEAIYGKKGIKAKYILAPRLILKEVAQQLRSKGAEIIIMGCTEIALALKQKRLGFVTIDPSKIIADIAIKKALESNALASSSLVLHDSEKYEALEEEE